MDQATEERAQRALRAATWAGVLLAIAAFASSIGATKAVEEALPAAEAGENGPTVYFPGQFADVNAETTPHIESF